MPEKQNHSVLVPKKPGIYKTLDFHSKTNSIDTPLGISSSQIRILSNLTTKAQNQSQIKIVTEPEILCSLPQISSHHRLQEEIEQLTRNHNYKMKVNEEKINQFKSRFKVGNY